MDAAKSVGAVFNDTTAPSVPTLNAAAASSSQINLSWNASTDTGGSGLKGYNIYKLNGGNYVFLKQVLSPATTTSDAGLAASTAYSYKISSIDNANVESVQSGVATATTSATATFTLTVTTSGTGTGTVSSAPSGINNCSGTCNASFNSGTSVTLTPTAGTGSSFINWTGTSCSGSGSCSVTMHAAKSVGAVFNDTQAPTDPPSVGISNVTQTGLTLNWTSSTDNMAVTGYKLVVAYDFALTNRLPGYNDKDVGLVSTTPITGLSSGTEYYVGIKAYDAAGNNSGYSGGKMVPLPPIPTGFTATPGNGQVTLSWNAVPTATGYIVWSRPEGGSYTTYQDTAGATNYTYTLTNGIKYYFVVGAYNNSGFGDYTTEISATPQAPVVEQPYVSDIQYFDNGLKKQITYGNGVVTNYTYDANLRLKTIITTKGVDSIQSLTYEYDGVGNVTKITDGVSGEIKTFIYDELNRLTQADGNYGANQSSASLTFEYFPNGNIKKKDGLTYTYDPGQVKPHAVRSVGADTFGYDANGNMTSKVSNGVTTAYTFNTENQLTNISGTNSQFAYDDTGERIKKIYSGTTTRFVGDLYEDAGGATKEYVFVGGMRVASIAGSTVSFIHGDHLGGTNAVTNSTGTIIDRADYKPFGEFKQHTVGNNEGYYFTDQYNDSESGLYYYGARYYNPVVGRFVSPDWIVQAPGNTQSLNRYTYAWNNPVNFVDPTGNSACDMQACFSDGGGNAAFGNSLGNPSGFGLTGALAGVSSGIKSLIAGDSHSFDFALAGFNESFSTRAVNFGLTAYAAVESGFGLYNLGKGLSAGLSGLSSLKLLGNEVGAINPTNKILFGQKDVSRVFTTVENGSTFKYAGMSIKDVSQQLRAGKILANELPVEFVKIGGQNVAVNNRSLTALRRAGMDPTLNIDVSSNLTKFNQVTNRLDQMGGVPSNTIRIRGSSSNTSANF